MRRPKTLLDVIRYKRHYGMHGLSHEGVFISLDKADFEDVLAAGVWPEKLFGFRVDWVDSRPNQLKDNQIAALVNELTSEVPKYAHAQCLRGVISEIVVKHLNGG